MFVLVTLSVSLHNPCHATAELDNSLIIGHAYSFRVLVAWLLRLSPDVKSTCVSSFVTLFFHMCLLGLSWFFIQSLVPCPPFHKTSFSLALFLFFWNLVFVASILSSHCCLYASDTAIRWFKGIHSIGRFSLS